MAGDFCPILSGPGQYQENLRISEVAVHTRTLSDLPDQELVRQAQRGQEAFNVLVERYWQDIYRMAQTHLRVYCGAQACDSDAEDVAQEVFLRAYENLTHFDLARHTQFKAWLLGITLNCCREARRQIRKRSQHQEIQELVLQENESPDFDLWLNIHDTLRVLPERERQVLLLHYYEGYTWGEIAETLGEHREAIKKRAQRALHQLRRTFRAA